MHPNQHEIENIKCKIRDSLKVIRLYVWLLDSYVLDFYVDNHWQKLPNAWMRTLHSIPPEYLSDLLIPPEKPVEKIVWPLSLLALRQVLQRLCISRDPIASGAETKINDKTNQNDPNNNPGKEFSCLTHPKIKTILTKKNIKAKKRHEIERMSQLTAGIAKQLGVNYIVDFGSGLGHLARLLAFGHELNACCLEKEAALTAQANELDREMMELVLRFSKDGVNYRKPVHLNVCLNKNTSFEDLVQEIRRSFNVDSNDESFSFGISGLHPCGDLASILTNFFLSAKEAKFLNLVGCCYFKITTSNDLNDNATNKGYPLSDFLLSSEWCYPKWHHLSFEAREIACHAIEVYSNRLSDKSYDYLRVHSFRAAIERIIRKHWPERKRSGLRSIKHLTTFREYCQQAVSHFDDMKIPDVDIEAPDTLLDLSNWKLVVIFYTLRLMLAPIVESVILYDRVLCLLEHGCKTRIDAIFDPVQSARNHIITAIKP